MSSDREKINLGNHPKEVIEGYGATAENPQGTPLAPTWDVPVSTVQLPSRGVVYPLDSAVHNRDHVEIRAMTARDEDILTSRALLRQGKAISKLLQNCLMNKMIDPDDMLTGDRNAVLIAIRVSGYGIEYDTKIECPMCDTQFDHSFDLTTIPVKSLSADPIRVGENAFEFVLPVSKKNVIFKLLTGKDEREFGQAQERIRKAKGVGAVENNVTGRLFYHIMSIDEETDRTKLQRMIGNMPAGDSLALRKYIDGISPGVEIVETIVCPSCGEESEVEMPVGADFFWPDSRT